MKKTITFLSMLLVFAVIYSCNSENNSNGNTTDETTEKVTEGNGLEGKWKRAGVDSINLVLELTANNAWKYYKDEKMVEEGAFVIEGDDFIMKHKIEDHSHEEGDEHHEHPEDHVYKFSLNDEKNELKLMHGEKTSVYNKL